MGNCKSVSNPDVDTALNKLHASNSMSVSLSRKHIGPEGAKNLGKGLQQYNIKTLNLPTNDLGLPGIKALEQALLHQRNSLIELDLRGNQINDKAAQIVGNIFRDSSTLEKLNLSNNQIGSQGIKAIAQIHSLKQLRLVNNNIGPEGAIALGALLPQSQLEILSLERNNIDFYGASKLIEHIPQSTTLRTINLSHNRIESSALTYLEQGLGTLRELHVADCEIDFQGVEVLARALQTNTSLVELNLRENKIGSGGAIAMGNCLKQNTTVQYLYISTNEIDVDGARSLADGLKENSTLRELRLSSNIFSADGTIAIFAALKVNKTLNTLGMDESGKLDVDAIALIGDALQQNHDLASLSLSRNQIDEEGGRALLAALKRNDTLKTINLAGNDLSDGLRKQSIRSWNVATSQTFSLDSLLGRHPRTLSS